MSQDFISLWPVRFLLAWTLTYWILLPAVKQALLMLQGRILFFLSPFLLINLTYSFPQEESPPTTIWGWFLIIQCSMVFPEALSNVCFLALPDTCPGLCILHSCFSWPPFLPLPSSWPFEKLINWFTDYTSLHRAVSECWGFFQTLRTHRYNVSVIEKHSGSRGDRHIK